MAYSVLNLVIVACGAAFAAIVGRHGDLIGQQFAVMDYPDPVGGRKRHERVTPLVGGIGLAVPLIVTALAVEGMMDGLHVSERNLLGWLVASTVGLFFLGYLDDRLHLAPFPRLFATIALVVTPIAFVPNFELAFLRFSFMDSIRFLDALGPLFTSLCLVGLVNATNMADGKNGLVIGMTLTWTVLLLLYAPPILMPVLLVLAGALAVLFIFNVRGRLFLGDAGSYCIAGFLGLAAIYTYNENFVALAADQVALWFLIPVLDCLRLMAARVLAGRSPFSGDREHLHHHLAKMLGWTWGLQAYLAMVAVPAVLSYLRSDLTMVWALLTTAIYAVTVALAGRGRIGHELAAT